MTKMTIAQICQKVESEMAKLQDNDIQEGLQKAWAELKWPASKSSKQDLLDFSELEDYANQ